MIAQISDQLGEFPKPNPLGFITELHFSVYQRPEEITTRQSTEAFTPAWPIGLDFFV
jgi:hypothetical protein